MIQAVSEVAQGGGDVAQGGDGFAADLGDDGGVDVGSRVADFHLDEFDGLVNALANAGWRWRRITAHRENLSRANSGGSSAESPLSV
jgi:hypothetical protein